MNPPTRHVNLRLLGVLIALLMVGAFLVNSTPGGSKRTVTAYFDQTVSIFEGSEVAIMGVPVGRVTAMEPQGDRVEVRMEYDDQYELPENVEAVIVTSTLVSDRFVQLTPAYDGGATMDDGGEIPMDRTAVPVEMDRIYASLAELTEALGPNGANKNGALSDVLSSGVKALEGNGKLGQDTIRDLASVSKTLGDNSDELFGTISSLAEVTRTLAKNEDNVSGFMTDLSQVSQQLAGESDELERALQAIEKAVRVTKDFVKDNKQNVVGGIDRLNETLAVLAEQRDTLGEVIQLAPLGLGNLVDAFDPATGTVGIRLQLEPLVADLPNILCASLETNGIRSSKELCQLFKALVPSGTAGDALTNITDTATGAAKGTGGGGGDGGGPADLMPSAPPAPPDAADGVKGLLGEVEKLMEGDR